jgi:predicted PurR-regulated permease PerM
VASTPDSPRQLIAWGIAMAALAVILAWALYVARGALLLIYISGVLAMGFSPIVRLIERQRLLPVGTRRFPRWLAILMIYFAIIGTLTMVAIMVLPPLVQQARDLANRLPEMLDKAQTFLMNRGLLTHRITLREAVERAPGSPGDTVGTVLGAVAGVVGGIFGLVTILILTFYLLVESDSLYRSFKRLFPAEHRDRAFVITRDISIKVSAWLNGQLILAATIGGSAALGLWLLGVPYFYVLALIAAIGEMIPVVGPILSAIPAVLVALTVSPQKAIAVILFFVLQQQFENHVLVPKVMERQVGISAAFVIIALLFGGSLLGILGAVLAVPTAAIIQVVFQELFPYEDRHP